MAKYLTPKLYPCRSGPLIFVIGALFFCQCKNYIGNPHATATPPRVVSVLGSAIQVEPAESWIGPKKKRVVLQVQKAGIAEYTVSLGTAPKVKLIKVEKCAQPDCLLLTLSLRKKVKPQKIPLFFNQGLHTFTYAHPLRSTSTNETEHKKPKMFRYHKPPQPINQLTN